METIAPRTSYDRDELGITDRLPLVSGGFYGAGMGAFVFSGYLGSHGLQNAAIRGTVAALFCGILFGALFPRLLLRMARRMNDRVYAGDPAVVPAPPAGQYLYRLPCGWMRTPKRAVSGVLYIGPGGLRFIPHLNNPPRYRDGWRLQSLNGVSVHRRDVPLPTWMRLWGTRTAPRVEIVQGTEHLHLTIPDTAATLPRLQSRITELQTAAAPP